MIKLKRISDVLRHRFGGEQVELLENHADLLPDRAQLALVQCRDVGTEHGHRAGSGTLQCVDQPHQSGFAGTGIADDAENVATVNAQADIIHGSRGLGLSSSYLELFDHVIKSDDGIAHCCSNVVWAGIPAIASGLVMP